MLNPDLLQATQTLLGELKNLRSGMDALNVSFMEAMGQEDKVSSVRAIFPEIIDYSERSAAVISGAFLSVDWEQEGNSATLMYDILSGVQTDVPEELKAQVEDHLEHMKGGTEAKMIELFGKDPMISCIQNLGLAEELATLISERDEVQALTAALQDTKDVPLAIQE